MENKEFNLSEKVEQPWAEDMIYDNVYFEEDVKEAVRILKEKMSEEVIKFIKENWKKHGYNGYYIPNKKVGEIRLVFINKINAIFGRS